ncbi:hypothetical protein [Leptolyngbya sp. ST-U4]|uniref:hypothetical protein n=1 Tax=Leptolyngbya sp. ST-U4 TaxID=2933912 RepID=UPI003298300E
MLGSSGAGKTVFLASLFKHLMIQGESRFFVEVEDERKRKSLGDIYAKVVAPEGWPPATQYREFSEWTFTCCVKVGISIYPACRFTYLDYAGGRITDVIEGQDANQLGEEVGKADALLGLLDGQKIDALLSQGDSMLSKILLEKDLPSMLRLMQTSKAPIQFVISKWDLLEGKHTLEQIRERLMQIPAFREIVESRNTIVRLIPVSSVGSNFATLQNGKMKKNPAALPHPAHVEVPLACVFPDSWLTRINQLKAAESKLKSQPVQKNAAKFIQFGQFGQFVLNLSGRLLPADLAEFQIATFVTQSVIGVLTRNAAQRNAQATAKLRQEREATLKAVKNEETALNHAVNCFLVIQDEFLNLFPDSELVAPTQGVDAQVEVPAL